LESDHKELAYTSVKWTIKKFAKGISYGQTLFATRSFSIEYRDDGILRVQKFRLELETSKDNTREDLTEKNWVSTLLNKKWLWCKKKMVNARLIA
jgi:hypothetical protein